MAVAKQDAHAEDCNTTQSPSHLQGESVFGGKSESAMAGEQAGTESIRLQFAELLGSKLDSSANSDGLKQPSHPFCLHCQSLLFPSPLKSS